MEHYQEYYIVCKTLAIFFILFQMIICVLITFYDILVINSRNTISVKNIIIFKGKNKWLKHPIGISSLSPFLIFINSIDYFLRAIIWGFLVMATIELGIYELDQYFFNEIPILSVALSILLAKAAAFIMKKVKNFSIKKIEQLIRLFFYF